MTPSGVIIANYERAGKVKTGTLGAKGGQPVNNSQDKMISKLETL